MFHSILLLDDVTLILEGTTLERTSANGVMTTGIMMSTRFTRPIRKIIQARKSRLAEDYLAVLLCIRHVKRRHCCTVACVYSFVPWTHGFDRKCKWDRLGGTHSIGSGNVLACQPPACCCLECLSRPRFNHPFRLLGKRMQTTVYSGFSLVSGLIFRPLPNRL